MLLRQTFAPASGSPVPWAELQAGGRSGEDAVFIAAEAGCQ